MPAKERGFKKLCLIGLGLGLLLLAPFAWLLPTAEAEEEDQEENKVWCWHCPRCGLEMACPPEAETKVTPCPRCVHEGVSFEVQERPSGKNALLADFTGDVLLKVTITALALLLASLLLFGQLRSSPQSRRRAPVGSAAESRAASAKHQEIDRWMARLRGRRRTS